MVCNILFDARTINRIILHGLKFWPKNRLIETPVEKPSHELLHRVVVITVNVNYNYLINDIEYNKFMTLITIIATIRQRCKLPQESV